MIFLYKQPNGTIIISERPYGQVKRERWELLETFKTVAAAEQRAHQQYRVTPIYDPRGCDRYERRGEKRHRKARSAPRLYTATKWGAPTAFPSTVGHPRYNDPWKTRTSRAKQSASKAKAWRLKRDVYFVIRPDGKGMRVWLPEGKEHAILPPGWRFGRLGFPAWVKNRRTKDS